MIRVCLLCVFFLWQFSGLMASHTGNLANETEPDIIEVVGIIQNFMDETDLVLSHITEANKEDAVLCKQQFYKLNLKWTKYYFSIENLALEYDEVLNLVVQLDDKIKELEELINKRFLFFKQEETFRKEQIELHNYLKEYEDMEKTALALSLTKEGEDKLKKLKAKEEILFGDVSSKFMNMKSILNEYPEIEDAKENEMEQLYANISVKSQTIRSAEYKPFVERIKVYLYSLAAVSLILMFVNMIQTKISAAKALKENAKVLENLQKRNSNEYPTI